MAGAHGLSYEARGAGPVALLLHGSPGRGRAWARVGERLAGRFRVIAPDLPGHGESPPVAAAATAGLGPALERVEALVREVGAPAVVAGHSYGGVVALGLALRGRVAVGALALFEPVVVPVLALAGEHAAYREARRVFDEFVARVEGGRPEAIALLLDFWFGPGSFARLPAGAAATLVAGAAAAARDVQATFREAYATEGLRALDCPLAMMVGAHSPDVTHRIARALAGHVSAGSVTVLAGATHALTTTHPEAVAEAIAAVAATGAPERSP